MRKVFCICFLVCFASVISPAQPKAFADFDKAVKEQRGGFNGNKEYLSKIFNNERIRLGDNFEAELWKYIGDDFEKHYWLNFFVEANSYLHGSKPLPEVAFQIRRKGLELIDRKNDKSNLGKKVSLNRKQAIYYHNNGKFDSARENKEVAEKILMENNDVSAYVSAMSRLEKCIYSNLGADTSFCEKESQKPVETIVASGYVNSIAAELPQPENPQNLKGEVHIKVLIGENGDIVLAEAISGVKALFDVAIVSAKKVRFKPFTLSGKPTKRSGIIVYKFS